MLTVVELIHQSIFLGILVAHKRLLTMVMKDTPPRLQGLRCSLVGLFFRGGRRPPTKKIDQNRV